MPLNPKHFFERKIKLLKSTFKSEITFKFKYYNKLFKLTLIRASLIE